LGNCGSNNIFGIGFFYCITKPTGSIVLGWQACWDFVRGHIKMGIFDYYKNMVKIQIAGATQGTTKFGWLESISEFMQFGAIVSLCFAQGWVVFSCLLLAVLLGMIIITITNRN